MYLEQEIITLHSPVNCGIKRVGNVRIEFNRSCLDFVEIDFYFILFLLLQGRMTDDSHVQFAQELLVNLFVVAKILPSNGQFNIILL